MDSNRDVAAWQARIERELVVRGGSDAAHDLGHLRRVLGLARRIAAQEPGSEPLVITAAALLHDIVNLPKNDPQRASSSRLAAVEASNILTAMGFRSDLLPAVAHAIEAHSFSAGIPPTTAEARALRDADRLDALGAIGIARCFAVSGVLGRPLVDCDDPLAENRPLDDVRFALDHFQTKLLLLHEGMTTAVGQSIAMERTAYLREFMIRMADECSQVNP